MFILVAVYANVSDAVGGKTDQSNTPGYEIRKRHVVAAFFRFTERRAGTGGSSFETGTVDDQAQFTLAINTNVLAIAQELQTRALCLPS